MCEIDFGNMDLFTESEDCGYEYRKKYVDSIGRFIQKSYEEAAKKRKARFTADNFLSKQEDYRREYIRMLGIPPHTQEIPKVKSKFVGQDGLCNIFRLSIEVLEDFYFYGILFVPQGAAHAPLVIAQHGGGGSPEFCADMCGENNYSHFTKKALAKQGITYIMQGTAETVTAQLPEAGQQVAGDSQVILYFGTDPENTLVEVPDFSGMTRQQASDAAGRLGLYILPKGNMDIAPNVTATVQSVAPKTKIKVGSSIELTFTDTKATD